MEIAELKSFISYAGFFLLSLLEKSYSDFKFSKTTGVASTPSLLPFSGPDFSDTRYPILVVFLHKDGLE